MIVIPPMSEWKKQFASIDRAVVKLKRARGLEGLFAALLCLNGNIYTSLELFGIDLYKGLDCPKELLKVKFDMSQIRVSHLDDILKYAKKHCTFTVNDLKKLKVFKDTPRLTLASILNSLSSKGKKHLVKVSSGELGRGSRKSAVYSLRVDNKK